MKKIYENAVNLYAGVDKKGRIVGIIDLDKITTRKMLKVIQNDVEVGFIDCNSLLLEVKDGKYNC